MNGQTFSTNPRKEGKSHHLIMFPTNQRAQQKQWLFPLACKDGQGRFNESFFACAFFFLSAFLYMEISSCTPIPLFTTKNQYTVPQPAEITGQAFPAKLHVSLFTCDRERMYIYKPRNTTLSAFPVTACMRTVTKSANFLGSSCTCLHLLQGRRDILQQSKF